MGPVPATRRRPPRARLEPSRTRPPPPTPRAANLLHDFEDRTLAHGHDGARIAPGQRWATDVAWAVRGGRQPVRSLRPLPRVLPDVLGARDGDGLAARAHLPHQVPGRRKDVAQRLDGAASFALSRLPRVRDRAPGRGPVRAAPRGGQGRDRATTARRADAPALPLAELRATAGAPAPARSRRVGGAPLSSER